MIHAIVVKTKKKKITLKHFFNVQLLLLLGGD